MVTQQDSQQIIVIDTSIVQKLDLIVSIRTVFFLFRIYIMPEQITLYAAKVD